MCGVLLTATLRIVIKAEYGYRCISRSEIIGWFNRVKWKIGIVSIPYNCSHDFSWSTIIPKFTKINSLPGSEV